MSKNNYNNRGQDLARKKRNLTERVRETPIGLEDSLPGYTHIDPSTGINPNPEIYRKINETALGLFYPIFEKFNSFLRKNGFFN